MPVQFRKSFLAFLLLTLAAAPSLTWAQWTALGPYGGDVRSLAYDPHNPNRVFLGTSAGQLFVSNDNGASWAHFAHLGAGNDYVLDHIKINPHTGTMYVAAWSIEQESGDLFLSRDGGLSWETLAPMHGKSVRALAISPADPAVLVAGTLDGVFRSRDGGGNWERISPLNHAEIKNIESVAIDPLDANIVYAGTWHLAWKTDNGGRDWHPIRRGVIDDSDVFSIIVDHSNRTNVYLSACSGIYKSENAGEDFRKAQGIPFSARRTRVLKQDPANPAAVYAGTTEGLWKTLDGGKTWRRITAVNVIVNDVYIDPRNPRRLLIATDRGGILASNDAGQTFAASNRGFAHRQVWSVLADRFDRQTLYAGVVNDKEFGGMFISRNGGQTWEQVNSGIVKLDIFSLRQTDTGSIIAGTNHGVFELARNASGWRPLNLVISERLVPVAKSARTRAAKGNKPVSPRTVEVKSELDARVAQLELTGEKWFAATSKGLFQSVDHGKSWRGGPVLGESDFRAVHSDGELVLAVTTRALLLSSDHGANWKSVQLPAYVTPIFDGALAPENALWLASREGGFRSRNFGLTWEHAREGLPARQVTEIAYDPQAGRLLAIAGKGDLYVSSDRGQSWQRQNSGFTARSLGFGWGRLLVATDFDGVVIQPAVGASAERPATGSSGEGTNGRTGNRD